MKVTSKIKLEQKLVSNWLCPGTRTEMAMWASSVHTWHFCRWNFLYFLRASVCLRCLSEGAKAVHLLLWIQKAPLLFASVLSEGTLPFRLVQKSGPLLLLPGEWKTLFGSPKRLWEVMSSSCLKDLFSSGVLRMVILVILERNKHEL